ncbi:Beta-ketoadipate enol-lactone hydrolase [Alloactinosynnema sp. L-07]|uniref:alpha/beta fold hydrolase n=1 Tax=Alloactinosynnema sp. L-07 TaxID=1653480 RepID=UPI00065EEF4D|nr:alpha/beta fold hydrolase [Alloactinosynnema sp. L-07]CRK58985.1 Beta-ketoadipate enol-lactone hydrolase [Alloactinosynnema sp. L-07]
MHLTDTGSGIPLVLLHAFPFDSRMWDPVRDGLSDVVRLITPDLRGFGQSSLGAADPSLAALGRDVIDLLDDLGIDRAVVGGCSMGGYVTMATLRAAPERVSGLLLIDTKSTADTAEAKANRLAVADRADREGIAPWFADTMLPLLIADQDKADHVRAQIEAQDPATVAWASRAMAGRPDSADTLRAAGVPALIVHGELDKLMPVTLAQDLADQTGGELKVLPGSGHMPSIEVPEAFLDAVTPWLADRS